MSPLFDRYIAVDWSAENKAKSGKDSIWIAEALNDQHGPRLLEPENPTTRHAATQSIERRIAAARRSGQRVLIGFDFAFGYPAGAAKAITGTADWQALWQTLASAVNDDATNRSNNYAVADAINARLPTPGPRYWGRPAALDLKNLLTGKSAAVFTSIPERRIVERLAKGTKAVWQLHYNGAVGSQAMLGIPRLQYLRQQFGSEAAIWPFETDFERNLAAPVVIAEIYPSLFAYDKTSHPPDRAQVEAVASSFARFDAAGRLGELLAAPSDLGQAERRVVTTEEGWIVGAGRSDLTLTRLDSEAAKPSMTYLRDPAAIYEASFATIRAEADLAHLHPALHPAAIRMIHACGMVDLAADIVGDPAAPAALRAALAAGAPVLCDCEMVRSGVIRRKLPPGTELVLTLNDPAVPALAAQLGTTRSAAAVELWRTRLAGAIVLIGNAPTALFRLLEIVADGAPRPATIIATPVGFVGAAESKALLAAGEASIPFLTVRGRRGGSAIASAAFNAIAGDAADS